MEHNSIALPVSCFNLEYGAVGRYFMAEWHKGNLTERTLKYPLR